MKHSFSHIAPNLGYLSTPINTHNGVFNQASQKCIDSRMKKITLPNNLKAIREYRGMSQEALAHLVGTKKGQIYKLETGERKLTHLWMAKLSLHLRCKPEDFVKELDILTLDNKTQENSENLRDSEIALIDAIKDLIQIMTLTNPNIHSMLRNAFSFQRAEYEEKNLPGAVQIMEILGRFVGEATPGTEQKLIRRLLQIAPAGSA